MNEQDKQIGIVSRGDVVRAIRQSIADSGIDLNEIVREAVTTAVEKRINAYNFSTVAEKAAREAASNSLYEIRTSVAQLVARRIRMDDK